MPRPPNPQVRQRLLDAGLEMIHTHGFNGSGVKDFTEAAGVPKGSFYSYFESKEVFAVSVVEYYWSTIDRDFGALLRDPAVHPVERIGRFFRAMADDNESRNFTMGCLIGNLTLEFADHSVHVRRQLADLMDRWEDQISGCIRAAQQQGDVAGGVDARDLSAMIIEAWEGAVLRGKIDQRRRPYDRFDTVVLPRLLGTPVRAKAP